MTLTFECKECDAVYHKPAASNYDKKKNEAVDKSCPFCNKGK